LSELVEAENEERLIDLVSEDGGLDAVSAQERWSVTFPSKRAHLENAEI